MTNRYEQRYLIDLAFQIAHSFLARSVVAKELSSWVEDQDLGFDWNPEIDSFRKKSIPADVWSDLRRRLAAHFASVGRLKPEVLTQNVTRLAGYVKLGAPGP